LRKKTSSAHANKLITFVGINHQKMSTKRTLILSKLQIEQKVNRMAYEIYENNYEEKEIIIAGVAGGGYLLAEKLNAVLKKIAPIKTTLIEITINKKNPLETGKQKNLATKTIENKTVILVDDVLNSGKTMIYGAQLFLNHPLKRLSTLVLVDRGHNRYPIKADYIGLSLSTTLQEHIDVELNGKNNAVYLL
jgi:pyrimidine operon attenuation protein / uracil phosphoribosyltransferase